MKLRRIIAAAFFLLLTGHQVSPCAADSLKDVLDSKELSNMDRVTSSLKAKRQKIRPPSKNLDDMTYAEEIFKSEAKMLLVWLGWSAEEKFKSVSNEYNYGKEIVTAAGVYESKNSKKQYRVSILIPVPRARESKKMGLMPEFNQLRPPYLSIVGSEKIAVKGINADLYQKPGDSCSMAIDIQIGGLLNIESTECKDISEMVSFVETLDIARLNRKLSS